MPYRILITVSFPSPVIFRYHLPLNEYILSGCLGPAGYKEMSSILADQ